MLVSLLGWDFLSTKFTLQLRHLRCYSLNKEKFYVLKECMKNSESFYSFRLHNKVLKKKLDFQNCTFLRISTVQQISNSIYVNSFFFSIQYRLYQIGNVYKHCQCIGRSEMIQIRSRSRSYFGKNRQELAQFLVVVNYRDSDLIWLIF